MSGVYTLLGATTPSNAPAVTAEQLMAFLAEHTDLDPLWTSPGSHTYPARGEQPERLLNYVSSRQKYTVEGLRDAAAALSEARPDAVVTCREEWSDEEVGGEETDYRAGAPIARRVLSWHAVPLEEI